MKDEEKVLLETPAKKGAKKREFNGETMKINEEGLINAALAAFHDHFIDLFSSFCDERQRLEEEFFKLCTYKSHRNKIEVIHKGYYRNLKAAHKFTKERKEGILYDNHLTAFLFLYYYYSQQAEINVFISNQEK